MWLTWGRGASRAPRTPDVPPYLSRQPTEALTPALPLPSDADPRSVNFSLMRPDRPAAMAVLPSQVPPPRLTTNHDCQNATHQNLLQG